MKRFKLNTQLPLENSIRMVLEDIVHHMALYKEPVKKPENAIHQSRKSIKLIRAILKMIRDETGYSFYFRENRFFRDLSRRMSPARDVSVLLQTLNLLEKKYPEEIHETDLLQLREHLSSRKESKFQPLTGPMGELKAIAGELDKALLRINGTLHLRNRFESIEPGMRRIYRRARRHLNEMDGVPAAETFHEYRKNCRYLQHQVELIQPLFPELLKAYASTVDNHAEVLGKIRDFQRFETYLQQEISEVISDSSREKMRQAVIRLRLKTMKGVLRNGGLIFAETPRDFTGRIHRYWDINYSFN